MALDAIRKDLEGLSDEVKGNYKEQDGKFVLDVTSVDGISLENVTGLKSTVEALRSNERKLQQDVKNANELAKQLEKKFEGIDPEAAKNALSKMNEIAKWDGDKKLKEAIEIAERKMQAKMDELVKEHNTKVGELESELADSQTQLQDAVVTSKIIEAISKENGSVDLLVPHVRKNVNMVKDKNGRWQPEVVNDNGDPRIGDSQGNPMTIQQYVQELKSKSSFAPAFVGVNATGTGKGGDGSGSTNTKGDNVKIISASDKKAMSQSLEDIAKGKVQVNMEG